MLSYCKVLEEQFPVQHINVYCMFHVYITELVRPTIIEELTSKYAGMLSFHHFVLYINLALLSKIYVQAKNFKICNFSWFHSKTAGQAYWYICIGFTCTVMSKGVSLFYRCSWNIFCIMPPTPLLPNKQ